MPNLAVIHGFHYPSHPMGLPKLNPVEERIISPRLPFMEIRRLRLAVNYKIVGQVINVPINVDTTVNLLPRQCDQDQAINVHLLQNLVHKSIYLKGQVKKSNIKKWLEVLVESIIQNVCH